MFARTWHATIALLVIAGLAVQLAIAVQVDAHPSGEITSWYPYPFVDVATHGYARVVSNALIVTAVLGAVAVLLGFGDRKLRSAPDPVAMR